MRARLNNLNLGRFASPIVLGVVVGVIVIALCWWFFWMQPEATKLNNLHAQEATLNNQIATLNAKIVQLQQESKTVKKDLPYLLRFQAAVPSTPQQGAIVSQFTALADRTGVNMTSITDNVVGSPATPGGLATIPISISLSGNHAQVLNFLNGIYKLPRLVTIAGVNFSGSGGTTKVPNILNVSDGATYTMTIAGAAYTTGSSASSAG